MCGGTHGCRPTLYYFVGQGPCALPLVRWGIGGGVRAPRPYGGLQDVRGAGRGRHRPLRRVWGWCVGITDCHSQCAHWLRNDRFFARGCGRSGRCGERTERCRWQRKRSERVAAVKISSVRRKAAQKFWAPQQDHRPLRKRILRCVGAGLSCPPLCRPTDGHCRARQSGHFLETGLLHPPLAALRRFPLPRAG